MGDLKRTSADPLLARTPEMDYQQGREDALREVEEALRLEALRSETGYYIGSDERRVGDVGFYDAADFIRDRFRAGGESRG